MIGDLSVRLVQGYNFSREGGGNRWGSLAERDHTIAWRILLFFSNHAPSHCVRRCVFTEESIRTIKYGPVDGYNWNSARRRVRERPPSRNWNSALLSAPQAPYQKSSFINTAALSQSNHLLAGPFSFRFHILSLDRVPRWSSFVHLNITRSVTAPFPENFFFNMQHPSWLKLKSSSRCSIKFK